MRFFASLRRFFARDMAKEVFTAVIADIIKTRILPKVKKMEKRAKGAKKQKLTALRELYEKYGNERSSEARLFGQTGAEVLGNAMRRFDIPASDKPDLIQNIALAFYRDEPLKIEVPDPSARGGRKKLRTISTPFTTSFKKVFDKFKVEDGPVAMNHFFGHILKKHFMWMLRDIKKELLKPRLQQPMGGPEGESLTLQDVTPAPQGETELDREFMRDVFRDLRKYIHRKFNKPVMRDMFDTWLELAITEGADRVVMKKDVYPVIGEKYEIKEKWMHVMWMDIKRAMLSFFEEEMNMKVTDSVRKKLHLSSVDAITYGEFRRRLAVWVLPSLFYFRRMGE